MTREIDDSTIQSIRDRLKNRAQEENEDFNLVVIRYALERLMYRLSKSDYTDQFVLKGATLFLHWQGSLPRPTRDADFAGYEEIEINDFVGIIKELCEMEIDEEDGMIYLPETVQGQRIREGATYEGIRVQLKGKLGNQKPTIQFDLGFGDSLVPAPEKIEYPTMLDFPAPKLKAYQQETTIAEKIESIVDMGMSNSRLKDFYDIRFLSKEFDFKGSELQEAISETFKRRETDIPADTPIALTEEFINDDRSQRNWRAFLNDLELTQEELPLSKVVNRIEKFVTPVFKSINSGEPFSKKWDPSEGWI